MSMLYRPSKWVRVGKRYVKQNPGTPVSLATNVGKVKSQLNGFAGKCA